MVRRLLPLLLLLACGVLRAQDKPIELSVGYPSTTIAYVEGDVGQVMKTMTDPGLLKGMGVKMEIPDLGKLVTEGLEIDLTDAEVRELLAGVERASWGLLDIGVGRPRLKMQIVLRHKSPALLAKALARAQEQGAETIISSQEYEGVKIYEVELPAREVQVDPEAWGATDPMQDFFAFDTLFVAVHGNKHILAATGLNYIKDAIDFLSFPDDATDTLAGNKRFKDALVEFDKPDALGFINTTALINTIERVSGDKGNTPLNEIFGGWIRFTVELLEYKQLKSIAAGLWVDEKTNTLRMDARIQFHNEPALYSAIKLKPVPQPLTEFVPADTMFGQTYGIEKPRELYTRVMNLLRSRAKESGQQEVLKELDRFEETANGGGVKIEEILDQLAHAQALLVLPSEPGSTSRSMPFETVALFQLRDVKEAESFLYEKLLKTKFGEELRKADLDITIIDDVEIHHPPSGPKEDPIAFAFVKDVFIFGNLKGIKRVVAARKSGQTLSAMPAYKQARGMIWNDCGSSAYLNVGAAIEVIGGGRRMYMYERPQVQNVDATTEENDPTPYLAKFFSGTVLVWGTQARENELALRLCVAGWPGMDKLKVLAEHFRDVARNKQVRNDFIQILNGATTHFAIKGKAAKSDAEIRANGYLPKNKSFIDPFSEEGEQRAYAFAEVPDTLDIRQAVLLVHQAKPGLDGKHLAVLWNGYIVKLTPQELKLALERAKKGLGIENFPSLQPLIAARREEMPGEEGPSMMEVEVIDDDGTERSVSAVEGDALDAERKVDQPEPDEHNEDEE
jgi:hypothetical protein